MKKILIFLIAWFYHYLSFHNIHSFIIIIAFIRVCVWFSFSIYLIFFARLICRVCQNLCVFVFKCPVFQIFSELNSSILIVRVWQLYLYAQIRQTRWIFGKYVFNVYVHIRKIEIILQIILSPWSFSKL